MTDMPVTTPSPSGEPHGLRVVLAWILIGAAVHAYFRATSPRKIAALGNFLAEEDLAPDEVPDEVPDALLAASTPAAQRPSVAAEAARRAEFHGGEPR